MIPSTVIFIGTGAFACCHALKQVIFSPNSSLECIRDKAFLKCGEIEEIFLPDALCSIGEDAFFLCTALKKLRLPLSDERAYHMDLSVESGFSPIYIHRYAFSNCSSLTDVRLPVNLQEFDSRIFEDCDNLKKLYFPRDCSIVVMTEKQDFLLIDLHLVLL